MKLSTVLVIAAAGVVGVYAYKKLTAAPATSPRTGGSPLPIANEGIERVTSELAALASSLQGVWASPAPAKVVSQSADELAWWNAPDAPGNTEPYTILPA